MDRTHLHTGGIFTLLALNRKIDISFLRHGDRIVVMFRVFEVDQISPLEPENPDPLKLRFVSGLIIFFHARINTSSASDAPRKLEAIAPKGIRKSFLGTDLKFLPILFEVSLFQLCDDPFLFFRGHLDKTFLQKIFGLLFCTGGEKRESHTSQGG
jgi:hypothetical protein